MSGPIPGQYALMIFCREFAAAKLKDPLIFHLSATDWEQRQAGLILSQEHLGRCR